jgi:hypothetical protein
MAVIIREYIDFGSGPQEVNTFLPKDILSKSEREQAERLDSILKNVVEEINKEYDTLDKEIKNNEIAKWRWLGGRINDILSIPFISEKDKENHHIWPAIGQYLRHELSRGLKDRKRSGTKNDHYRKCWALATLPGTGWVTSWIGWDAFTDRGEQLAYSGKLLPLLEKRFENLGDKLTPDDFKEIAKLLVEYIPTKARTPKDIEFLPEHKLVEIADTVYETFVKNKNK